MHFWRCADVSKQFPGVQALRDVSIDLAAGEVLGLVGENGAGKSTLIKILNGDYQMDAGEILINGQKVYFRSPSDAAEQGIRVLYQELITLDTLTVAENLLVGHLPTRRGSGLVDWKAANENARAVLRRMNIDLDPRTIVGDLTVHQKQVLEIAKAIHKKATILVMDEPTAALGEEDTQLPVRHHPQPQGAGGGHRLHLPPPEGGVRDHRPGDRAARRAEDRHGGHRRGEHGPAHRHDGGPASWRSSTPNAKSPRAKCSCRCRTSRSRASSRRSASPCASGEIVGLFGLLGSGRMNVLRALYGLDRCDSGTITVRGRATAVTSPNGALAAGIGYMPIDRKLEGLALSLPVSTNITMANIDRIGGGFF